MGGRNELRERKLGYTSFGHPGLHPKFSWKLFDHYCDFALSQVYFELFSFKPTNAEEVKNCLDARHGLQKPIFPIWSSEPGAKHPASMSELLSSPIGRLFQVSVRTDF